MIGRVGCFKERTLKLKNDNTIRNDSDIFERLFVNRVSQKELLYEINNNSNNAHGYI